MAAHSHGTPSARTEPLPPPRRSTPLGAPVQRAAVPVAAAQPSRPASARPALGAPLSTRPADAAPLSAPSGIPIAPLGGVPGAAAGPGVATPRPPLTPPFVQRSTATPSAPELPLPTPASTPGPAHSTGTPTHRPAPLPQNTGTAAAPDAPTGALPRTVRPTTTTGQHHPVHPASLTGRPPASPAPVQRRAVKAPVPLRRTAPGAAAGQPVAHPYPTPDLPPTPATQATQATQAAPPIPVVQRRPLPAAPVSAATAPVRPATSPAPHATPASPALAAPVPMPMAPLPIPATPPTSVVQRRTAPPPPAPTKPLRAAALPADGEQAAASQASAHPGFDPRRLTDFQLDELTHRLTGRITRLLRTELRLDRERIGRLRDPRR
ncbi:hypothetical protein ACFWDQ_26790 [Streptomyces sp. NPDC060053]|uniref:hypothetical protein n=1 Tax=Streptomyces sp. NPDC060053 TaxID=3347047 RepID=UPI0036C2083A